MIVAGAEDLKAEEQKLNKKFKWEWNNNGSLIFGTTDTVKGSKDILALDMVY